MEIERCRRRQDRKERRSNKIVIPNLIRVGKAKNRTRVVFVVLQRNTAIPSTVRVENSAGLHSPIGECCARTCGNRSTSSTFSIAPWEQPSHEARSPAGSVVGHFLAWDRADGTSAFAVEEDQEDEGTNQG